MSKTPPLFQANRIRLLSLLLLLAPALATAQKSLPPLPAPQDVPYAGPSTRTVYSPRAIVPGGIVIPLYPPDSPLLNQERKGEAEKYTLSEAVPGRITNVVNVHNPSIEIHKADARANTGAVVIVAPGGGHRTLVIGSEGADVVPYFYNYGVNTVILRNRLRVDGYEPRTDAVHDALQAVRMVRAYAEELHFDPHKIGIMGFSAGAELSAPAAVEFADFDKNNKAADDPFAGITSRPDFVGIIYPGPSPFAANRSPHPSIPPNAPPAFIATAGSGDKVHAVWAMEYFSAMLNVGLPNIEMHIYGNGKHGGALTDRGGIPFGTWPDRYIDWLRDLGFLNPPGVETKAARDVAEYVANPPKK
ncbi:MAG: alpha/beta hydrolase fold domain-containing protein [Acidobacteria bacterium]|nr:alpha/beta hydrolase fold domain-containing protein [Acidobacteriota bacterium]